jgi:hypothetical protein
MDNGWVSFLVPGKWQIEVGYGVTAAVEALYSVAYAIKFMSKKELGKTMK